MIFPCPRSRLRMWSREIISAFPSRVSPLILPTQAGDGAYSRAPLLPPAFRDNVRKIFFPLSLSRVSPLVFYISAGSDYYSRAPLRPPAFRYTVSICTVDSRRVTPEFIGSLNCAPMAFTPRVRRQKASSSSISPRGSSSKGRCLFRYHQHVVSG